MGKAKKTRKFAVMKSVLKTKDARLKDADRKIKKKDIPLTKKLIEVPQGSSALFFQYNTALGPPYRILVDTNFINFAIKQKLDLMNEMMNCLLGKCIIYVTDCVRGEIERLGEKYRVALKVIKDYRFEPLQCDHKGIYADDCLVNRVTESKCFLVATCDKNLKRRIRKIPGIPIMSIGMGKFIVERMPDAPVVR